MLFAWFIFIIHIQIRIQFINNVGPKVLSSTDNHKPKACDKCLLCTGWNCFYFFLVLNRLFFDVEKKRYNFIDDETSPVKFIFPYYPSFITIWI